MKYTEEKWLDNFFGFTAANYKNKHGRFKSSKIGDIHSGKRNCFCMHTYFDMYFFLCVFTSINVLYTHTFINKRAMNGCCDRNRVILKKEYKKEK